MTSSPAMMKPQPEYESIQQRDSVTLRHRPDVLELPGETWRPLPFVSDRYQISDRGRVKSTVRQRVKILTPVNGRVSITLRPQQLAIIYVARLVVFTFIGPPQPGTAIRFMDGDRENPALSNLIIEMGRPSRRSNVIFPAWARVHGIDFDV